MAHTCYFLNCLFQTVGSFIHVIVEAFDNTGYGVLINIDLYHGQWKFINEYFERSTPGQLISVFAWPAWSSGLNAYDFLLCTYLKTLIFFCKSPF